MKATEASGWYQQTLDTWAETYDKPPVTEHYIVFFEL